jgi:hypothetical protein
MYVATVGVGCCHPGLRYGIVRVCDGIVAFSPLALANHTEYFRRHTGIVPKERFAEGVGDGIW